ncbi:hypothetical protein N7541_011649 [Penicillium brevicompactum]|uniref:F-box domain-containing protein n=1 Tax=Penicillium brevicompactum TaxID=5074 RepID=A0A9W9QR87_PENBR|nr:hypothetical protein N7541_011649 [Penicillium brevicompactum]
MSSLASTFPAEIWLIIIKYLQQEKASSQHLSRLSRTCRAFYEEVEPLLYETIILKWRKNSKLLAETLQRRPQLKALVKELRHEHEMGISLTNFSKPFYKQLTSMENLETLIFNPKWTIIRCLGVRLFPEPNQDRWRSEAEDLLRGLLLVDVWGHDVGDDWHGQINAFLSKPHGTGFPVGSEVDIIQAVFDLTGNSVDEWEATLDDRLAFCDISPDIKPEVFSSLRVCHLGTNTTLNPYVNFRPFMFSPTIFRLRPRLKELCMTGIKFSHEWDDMDINEPEQKSALENLTMLNCELSINDSHDLFSHARGLKRLVFRGPAFASFFRVPESFRGGPIAYDIRTILGSSLESLDIDIYWGVPDGLRLRGGMPRLRKLTATTQTLFGSFDSEDQDIKDFIPESLEELVIRHEEGSHLPLASIYRTAESGQIAKLHTVVVQIGDFMRPDSYPYRVVVEWKDDFQCQGINLSAESVPYPLHIPRYEACSCENLSFYHRFPHHHKGLFR